MSQLINGLTVVMVVCALTATGTLVRREIVRPAPTEGRSSPPSVEVKSWRQVADAGTQYGHAGAPIVITQFSDFQCPYCRKFHEALTKVENKYPSEIQLVFRHFPLERIHPHARPAAYAAECAARMGRFREYYDQLFSRQDSIGKISWGTFATRAGFSTSDTLRLLACMSDSTVAARVTADSIAGQEVGLKGTPTVLVNEWRLPGTPTFQKLDSIVQSLLPKRKR